MTTLLDLMGCEPGPRRLPAEPIARHAEFSDDGVYRWTLDRRWGAGRPVGFVMLNPSTGGAKQDDPTIRRVIMFAYGWGYRAVTIVNLYPFVTPHPSAMVAWRGSAAARGRLPRTGTWPARRWTNASGWWRRMAPLDGAAADDLVHFVRETCTLSRRWRCLGLTAAGWPKHPAGTRQAPGAGRHESPAIQAAGLCQGRRTRRRFLPGRPTRGCRRMMRPINLPSGRHTRIDEADWPIVAPYRWFAASNPAGRFTPARKPAAAPRASICTG